jgi:hypothetical protein
MNKKGQLTIFIIVGVILVASVALFFAFRGGLISEEGIVATIPETNSVNDFVFECVDEVGIDVINRIGDGGGYYFVPENSVSGVTIYYFDGINFAPSKEEVEYEISQYVAENLFFCTNNFVDFKDVDVVQGDIEVVTTIGNEGVNLEINYPISVAKGEDIDLINDFDRRISVRLGLIYDSLDYLIEENKDAICLTCLLENDLKININNIDDENVMFVVRDENLNGEVFEWAFAMRYENVSE